MKLGVNGGAHTLGPGEYEERETDHTGKKRSVPPERLRGDRERIQAHYEALQKQHQVKALYTSGVMRWTEALDQILQHEDTIIEDFEAMSFAGIDPCRFGRLWHRHLDKGVPELHWSFVDQDLLSGKLVPLYFGPRDRLLFQLWQERCNLRYGFTSPFASQRRKLFKVSHRSPAVRNHAEFALAQTALEAMFHSQPANRGETCARLEAAHCNILERREHAITIESSAGIIHLGGVFCHEAFNSPDYVQKVLTSWAKRQRDYFGSAEIVERRYMELLALRAKWLGHFLTEHRPRFGLEMPPFSAETISDFLSPLNTKTNYEIDDRSTAGLGSEIPKRTTQYLERIGSQARRLAGSAKRFRGSIRRLRPPARATRSRQLDLAGACTFLVAIADGFAKPSSLEEQYVRETAVPESQRANLPTGDTVRNAELTRCSGDDRVKGIAECHRAVVKILTAVNFWSHERERETRRPAGQQVHPGASEPVKDRVIAPVAPARSEPSLENSGTGPATPPTETPDIS